MESKTLIALIGIISAIIGAVLSPIVKHFIDILKEMRSGKQQEKEILMEILDILQSIKDNLRYRTTSFDDSKENESAAYKSINRLVLFYSKNHGRLKKDSLLTGMHQLKNLAASTFNNTQSSTELNELDRKAILDAATSLHADVLSDLLRRKY